MPRFFPAPARKVRGFFLAAQNHFAARFFHKCHPIRQRGISHISHTADTDTYHTPSANRKK